MTNLEKIRKFVLEIGNAYAGLSRTGDYKKGIVDTCLRIGMFIESLSEDSVCSQASSAREEPASNDLRDEIERLWKEYSYINYDRLQQVTTLTYDDFMKLGKNFTNWQREHMMKDAVERIVHIDAGGYPYIGGVELWDYDKDEPLASPGDRVKVLVIVEDRKEYGRNERYSKTTL